MEHGLGGSVLTLLQFFSSCRDLVALESIHYDAANAYGLNVDGVSEGAELEAFHFDVDHAFVVCLVQERKFVRLGILADGSIQSSLTFIKVVATHRLSDGCLDAKLLASLQNFLVDLYAKFVRSPHSLTENEILLIGLEATVESFLSQDYRPKRHAKSATRPDSDPDAVGAGILEQSGELIEQYRD